MKDEKKRHKDPLSLKSFISNFPRVKPHIRKKIRAFISEIPESDQSLAKQHLQEVFAHLNPEKAQRLFMPFPADRILRQFLLAGALNQAVLPLYSHNELKKVTMSFKSYLKKNRESIIEIGMPETSFAGFPWLSKRLSCTYPLFPLFEPADPPLHWTPLRGLKKEDMLRLKGARERFFKLKIKILDIIVDSLSSWNGDQLLQDCLDTITNPKIMLAEDAFWYLDKDNFYIKQEKNSGVRAGGLIDLLAVVGHYYVEIKSDGWSNIRKEFGNLISINNSGCLEFSWCNLFQAQLHDDFRRFESAIEKWFLFFILRPAKWAAYEAEVVDAFAHRLRDSVYGQLVKLDYSEKFKSTMEDIGRFINECLEEYGDVPPQFKELPSGPTMFPFNNSESFSWVEWLDPHGKKIVFNFTPKQSEAIAILCWAFFAPSPDIPRQEIMDMIELPNSNLHHLFRSQPGVMGTLITRGKRRGFVRLNSPHRTDKK